MYDDVNEGPQGCRAGCGYAAGDDGYCSDNCAEMSGRKDDERMAPNAPANWDGRVCGTCNGWGSVTIASDVISRCDQYGPCPDCVNGYADSGPNPKAYVGQTITRCKRTACYNQRNGRECWDAMHRDGSLSYEWENAWDAMVAAVNYTHRDIRIGTHRYKFC